MAKDFKNMLGHFSILCMKVVKRTRACQFFPRIKILPLKFGIVVFSNSENDLRLPGSTVTSHVTY